MHVLSRSARFARRNAAAGGSAIHAFTLMVVAALTGLGTAGLAQAPAALVGIGLVGAVEVEREVLLAGEVGAPGLVAAAAAVDRAADAPAGRISRGAHQRVVSQAALKNECRLKLVA